jgi:hypothetical protein
MNAKILALLAALLLLPLAASADVIYNWVALTPGEYGPVHVSISINDAYWKFGGSLGGPSSGVSPWVDYFGVDQFSVFDNGGSFIMSARILV